MPTTLHQRIALLLAAATLVAVSVTVVSNYQATRVEILQTVQDAFVKDLQARVHAARPALDAIGDASSVRAAQAAIGDDTIVAFGPYRAWGETLPREIPTALRQTGEHGPIGSYFQRTVLDSHPQLAVALVTGFTPDSDTDRVTVYGFRDLSDQQQLLKSLLRTSAAVTIPIVVVVTLLGFFMSRRLTRPLRTLERAARSLPNEDFRDLPLPARHNSRDEIAHLTKAFNETAKRLNDVVRDLQIRELSSRQFAEDVAHELRTPLSAMLAVVEVLESDVDSREPAAAAAVRTTATETRRLATLVSDLLEVSRPMSVERLVVADFELGALVSTILEARGLGDRVEVQVTREPVTVTVDVRRLELIVTNLVVNAIEHGEAPIQVAVVARLDTAVIRVRDHGPGIAVDDRHRIFDRFFKADRARGRTAGSGLGLAIAARNAELLGGSVALATTSSEVTEFTVTLPRRA